MARWRAASIRPPLPSYFSDCGNRITRSFALFNVEERSGIDFILLRRLQGRVCFLLPLLEFYDTPGMIDWAMPAPAPQHQS
jgi:hypothetical protein